MKRLAARLVAYYFASCLLAYFLVVLPLVILLHLPPAASFLLGMVAGALAPLIGLLNGRISDWVGL